MSDRIPAQGRAGRVDSHAVGLDIGASSIRAVVLDIARRDGEPVVEARTVAGAPLPPGTVVGGAVAEPKVLTEALKHLWRSNRIKSRNVILGVANPQVLVRELEIPDLSAELRAKALPFQAQELTAMPLDQMVLDFAPLGPVDPESQMQSGLLVACPREPVLAAIAAVEAADLKVVRVDLASLALLRAVADGRYDVEVIIDLGAHLTTVVVHQLGVPRLVRTLSRGGEELTRRLADQLKIDHVQAEEAKRAYGVGAGEPVSSALRDLVGPLLAELRSSINYFRTSNPSAQIQRIALTGGGGHLAGLTQLLTEQFGVPCEVESPIRQLVAPGRAKRPVEADQWASALSIGLAIGAAA